MSGIRRVSLALASDGGLGVLAARLTGPGVLERVLWNDAEPDLWTGVLPPGVDEPRLLADLIEAVHRAHSELAGRTPCLAPVLLVLHEGLVRLEGGQFHGPALATVRELGRVRLPDAFGVVVSQRVFEDIEALDVQPIPLARFQPVTVGGVSALAAGWPARHAGR